MFGREPLTNDSSQNGNRTIFSFYFSCHFFCYAPSFSSFISITGKSVSRYWIVVQCRIGGQFNKRFSKNLHESKVQSAWREMLLFLTINMAAVTSRVNPQQINDVTWRFLRPPYKCPKHRCPMQISTVGVVEPRTLSFVPIICIAAGHVSENASAFFPQSVSQMLLRHFMSLLLGFYW